MRGGERRHAGSTQRTERGLGTHRHSLRQLNSKRSGGGGGNSSCGDLPSSAAAAPLLAKRSALYGDPCPLCSPGAPGCIGPRSVPLGGRAGDGPPPAAEADTGGLCAAAVEVGIGGEGSAREAESASWGSATGLDLRVCRERTCTDETSEPSPRTAPAQFVGWLLRAEFFGAHFLIL